MLIGGEWTNSISGKRLSIINPADAREIGSVPDGGRADVDAAVRERRDEHSTGMSGWIGRPAGERARVLFRAAEIIESRSEEIAALETLDNGMPIDLSRGLAMHGAETFRYFVV